jgi:diguanylate cyclase (GGDEF)-like protein
MVTFGGIVYISLQRLSESVERLNEYGAQQAAAGDVRFNLTWLPMAANDYIITGKGTYSEEFKKQAGIVEEKFRILEAHDLTENERTIVNEVRVNFEAVQKLTLEIFSIKDPIGNPRAGSLMEEMDYKYAHPGAEKVTRLFDTIKAKRVKASMMAKEARRTIVSTIVIGDLSAVIISLVIASFITRSISRPIKALTEATQKIASGDLDVNVKISSKDEIGILSNTFNTMVSDLKHSLEEQKRLFKEEQRKVRQMAVFQEAITAIASDLAIESLLEHLAFYSATIVKAELSAVTILYPETGVIQYFKTNVPQDTFPLKKLPEGRGLLGVVLREGISLRLDNVSSDPRFEGLPSGHPFIETLLAVPILLKNKAIGGLFVANKENKGLFTQEEEDIFLMLALQSSTAIENARLYAKTIEMATTDLLTGIPNRRAFIEQLDREVALANRYQNLFFLLMIDIDYFKWINDTYGHSAGDAVLQSLARLLKGQVRTVDLVARYGGEEFVIILLETDDNSASLVAERIRKDVAHTPFILPEGNEIGLTVSIGVASFPEDAKTKDDLLRKTDQALYYAKEHGRNMIYSYRDTLAGMLEKKPEALDDILNDPSLMGIKELAMAIDSRSSYMRGHSLEVAAYAIGIAKAIGLEGSAIEGLRIASLLHDIGNVTIPVGILNKPGQLSDEEKMIIKGHPGLAEMLLKKHPHIEVVLPTILYHHERYDGKGYPIGLKGDAVPLPARILAVAEAFQSMVSTRPYKETLTLEQAIEELKRNAGLQFDPEIVEAFIKSLKRNHSPDSSV